MSLNIKADTAEKRDTVPGNMVRFPGDVGDGDRLFMYRVIRSDVRPLALYI